MKFKRNKASSIDDINSDIALDFFLRTQSPIILFFRDLLRERVFPDELKIAKVSPNLKEAITYRLKIIDQSQSFQYSQRY